MEVHVSHTWTWIRLITSQTDQNFTKTTCYVKSDLKNKTKKTTVPHLSAGIYTSDSLDWFPPCSILLVGKWCGISCVPFVNLRTSFQLNQSKETTAGCVLIENPPRTEHRKKNELLMVSVRQSFSNVCFRVKWCLWGQDLILNRMCLCVVSGVAWDQLLRLGQFLSSPL